MTSHRYITTLEDLCNYFDADEPGMLNKRLYKGTACGASISLYLKDGTAIHNGDRRFDDLPIGTGVRGFTIQTIVEGSDATVDSDEFVLPVAESSVDAWLKYMEEKASGEWEKVNLFHLEPAQRDQLLDLVWPHLASVPGHPELRVTSFGNKTEAGLIAAIEAIIQGQEGI